jgi:apolipoprotein N-acyltransferase
MQTFGRWLTSPWRRALLAALAGGLPMFTFPAPSLWWFAYVALVPWILLARAAPTGRRALVDGWCGGLGFMLAVHHWLLPSLHVFTVVLAALLGLLWAPWGWLVRRLLGGTLTPGRTAAALVVLPSGWLAVELVRSWQGLGGPWGMLGAGQWQVAPALRLASVGGVWLLSFLVVAVDVAVAVLVVGRAARVVAVAGLLATSAAASAAWVWAPRPEVDGHVRVAVVQPLRPRGGADPPPGGPASRPGRVGREQRRIRPAGAAGPGAAAGGAVPGDGCGRARERRRAAFGPARDLQEFRARRSGRPDR